MPMHWYIIGDTARGAAHVRHDKPNQDAWGFVQTDDYVCVAVADGHGSEKHYHSDIGAELAVTSALDLLQAFAAQTFSARHIKQSAEYLARKLVQAWRSAVDEFDGGKTPAEQRYNVYGTTLISTLVTADYALYLQIGDGDLLLLDAANHVLRPLQKQEQLLANETYSLSTEDAMYRVEHRLQFFSHHPKPQLIFLATDGYANSFADEFGLQQAVQDFQTQINEHGIKTVQENLAQWLYETSEQGSGDDVSVVLLVSAAQ